MINIALICGGPSKERGISLNSARSFLDHTSSLNLNLHLFYLNPKGDFYQLTASELYSNTPSDFDFKLARNSHPLKLKELIALLQKVDLVFPLIHGTYGEDGTLQKLLEENRIPFAGSPSGVCQTVFNKHKAREELKRLGFSILPSQRILTKETEIEPFWKDGKAVVKPTESGSSIGVLTVDSPEAAKPAIAKLWEQGFREMLIEPYCQDMEFTVCVLENRGTPVALLPLEIDIGSAEIFDYRKKYLPSEETRYYCPPRLSEAKIVQIQKQAEKLFQSLGLRDFARIDGWISKKGEIRFSDLNPLSGMEQNSFIFQQAARIGMTHADLIEYVLAQALSRYGKKLSPPPEKSTELGQPVFVLMGGDTSERQVSLLSGTNVWLKLRLTDVYKPTPFLLDKEGAIWELPYGFALHHSVEEMADHCMNGQDLINQALPLAKPIRKKLGLPPLDRIDCPAKLSLDEFLKRALKENAFVFLGLHGGFGEDGTLQTLFEEKGIPFNGSSAAASRLCMDKYETARRVRSLKNLRILAMPQISFQAKNVKIAGLLWERAATRFKTEDLIVKPQQDGCSTGVVRLRSRTELASYLQLLSKGARQALPGTFQDQSSTIEMPVSTKQPFILEPFIQTDKFSIQETEIKHQRLNGWCEMTIGILEKMGRYEALNPSITIAENHVLSVEEKFQGGTGINITPPPVHILPAPARRQMQRSACLVAKALGIQGYARLDLFVECATGRIRVIEANTLPALSPSTVLFQQALSATPPIAPKDLLAALIEERLKLCCSS